MNLEEKLSVINSIPPTKGIFGFSAVTEKKVLKKSRLTGIPTPERFQKITCEFSGVVFMGADYQEMVNKVRAKEGLEKDFESKPTYCRPVGENRLLFQHNTNGQLYFRVYLGYGATMTSECRFFDAFGCEIQPDEYKEVKAAYLPLEYESESQGTEQEIIVRNYKIENVTKLKRHENWIG